MRHYTSPQQLEDFLDNVLLKSQEMTHNKDIRLMVIDNITALCYEFINNNQYNQRKYGTLSVIDRSKFLKQISKKLKMLSHKYKITIVLVNNMVAKIEDDVGSKMGFFKQGEKKGGKMEVQKVSLRT